MDLRARQRLAQAEFQTEGRLERAAWSRKIHGRSKPRPAGRVGSSWRGDHEVANGSCLESSSAVGSVRWLRWVSRKKIGNHVGGWIDQRQILACAGEFEVGMQWRRRVGPILV